MQPSQAPEPVPAAAAKRILPWLVAVAFFMEALDSTILNTAVPAIAHALGVAPLSMKSVLSSYTLSLAVFIPVSGWVAMRFGTRRVFAGAIGLFTLGSLLCGLSRSIEVLVVCRIIQGCGGAMMLPVGRLTMVRTFAKSEYLRALSFVAIPGLVGPMMGPTIGGFLIEYFHWSVIFFVNIPIGLVGLWMVYRHLPDYREEQESPFDVVGFVLFGSGIALLSYVLEVFGEHTLGAAQIMGLLSLSAVLLGAYGFNSIRIDHPMLQLDLFRLRTFRASNVGSFVTRIGLGGIPFLLPLLYQVGFGFNAIESGLLIMPLPFAAMSLRFLIPRMLRRFGYRRVLIADTVMLGLTLALFATVTVHTPLWLIVAMVFGLGFLQSTMFTSLNTFSIADIDDAQASNASTISSTVQQLSLSFGIAAASLVTALFVPDRFHASPAEMIQGIHRAFLVIGAWMILAAVTFLRLRNSDGAAVSQYRAGPETA
ncbi:MAG: DHA2 family efflux MFS transporter permease subunit [Steroidobacterales bacterium]